MLSKTDLEWFSRYTEMVIYMASDYIANPYSPGESFLTITPDGAWHYQRIYYADFFDGMSSGLVPVELTHHTISDYLIPRYPEKWLGLREEGWSTGDQSIPPASRQGWTEENPQFNVKCVYLQYKLSGSAELFEKHEETIRRYILEHPGFFTKENGILSFTEEEVRSKDFVKRGYGFYDNVGLVGYNLFATLLLWESYTQMIELYAVTGNKERESEFKGLADTIGENLLEVFWNKDDELLFAATEINRQSDIWGSAFAVSIGILSDEYADKASRSLDRVYDNVVWRGQIRHMIEENGWELYFGGDGSPSKIKGLNRYQNGGYWGTATGWFVKALHRTNPERACQTVTDAIADYRSRGAYECVHPDGDYTKVIHYVSNVGLLMGALIDLGYLEPRVSHAWDGCF